MPMESSLSDTESSHQSNSDFPSNDTEKRHCSVIFETRSTNRPTTEEGEPSEQVKHLLAVIQKQGGHLPSDISADLIIDAVLNSLKMRYVKNPLDISLSESIENLTRARVLLTSTPHGNKRQHGIDSPH